MKRAVVLLTLALAASAAQAAPTGSPLIYQPVTPCRALDTRVALGALAANTAMDVYVRGSALPVNQGGSTNCGVPPSAEVVQVNVAAIAPTTNGHFKLNGTGGVSGSYSRVNYTTLENVSNEMAVGLCNAALFPADHAPCAGPTTGIYADFQVLNVAATGSTHVVVDVVGYFARMPLVSAVAGLINDKATLNSGAVELRLTSGMRVVCAEPYADPDDCAFLEVGWTVFAAGHVVKDPNNGPISIYAHGEIGYDQN